MAKANDDLFEYLIRLGDDHLILGHRLSQWCGHAPTLEEDLALSNIALDMIGQARSLYTYAGEVEGKGRSEDDLAFLRKEHEYHNLMLVERANNDFAHTIIRQLFFSVYAELLWEILSTSGDEKLSQIAAKARKEASYHVRHSAQWTIRLGDGTQESAARIADAVKTMAPNIQEMFDDDAVLQRLVQTGVIGDVAVLKAAWHISIAEIFSTAKIDTDLLETVAIGGARPGRHTESMGHILAELQYMQRTYPGCQW
ncbi:MAG: phenylacetate-CoA oxygenase subunit PaaC [Rhizobiaceae bacterium]|nr:phenylacetate-CoA oxygenase subunit PaaC [Rhizobiaceae bacterium]